MTSNSPFDEVQYVRVITFHAKDESKVREAEKAMHSFLFSKEEREAGEREYSSQNVYQGACRNIASFDHMVDKKTFECQTNLYYYEKENLEKYMVCDLRKQRVGAIQEEIEANHASDKVHVQNYAVKTFFHAEATPYNTKRVRRIKYAPFNGLEDGDKADEIIQKTFGTDPAHMLREYGLMGFARFFCHAMFDYQLLLFFTDSECEEIYLNSSHYKNEAKEADLALRKFCKDGDSAPEPKIASFKYAPYKLSHKFAQGVEVKRTNVPTATQAEVSEEKA